MNARAGRCRTPSIPTVPPGRSDAEPALIGATGTHVAVEHTTTPIRAADGTRTGAVTVLRDVAARRLAHREADYHATHDPLTGLANRRDFEHRLEDAIARAATGEAGALLAIDLDRFKAVNDTGGHAAGDAVLCRVAALLQEEVRSDDVVARVGGDEFAVILERCSLQRARHIATKVATKIGRTAFRFEGDFHHIGASVGLAVIDRSSTDVSAVCRVADVDCYEQKQAGRTRRAQAAATRPTPPTSEAVR
jgi:diguanylate cyclase